MKTTSWSSFVISRAEHMTSLSILLLLNRNQHHNELVSTSTPAWFLLLKGLSQQFSVEKKTMDRFDSYLSDVLSMYMYICKLYVNLYSGVSDKSL